MQRILALPKRELTKEVFAHKLTEYLAKPGCKMQLKDLQTTALREFYEYGGLFGPLAVGTGKTLITLLAPVLSGSQRPLLLIPASLRHKTDREIAAYGEHFKMHPNLSIMNYELLSRERGQKEFEALNPDLIIADECHRLKNAKAACTRRVARHMKQYPDTQMVAVSGTMTSKSLMDYWHILKWCLKDNAPVPEGWREAKDWSLALDEKLPFEWERLQPGALLLFCNPPNIVQDNNPLKTARNGFRDRLTQTPAVVATGESELGTSLFVKTKVIKQSDRIEKYFRQLRETWMTPNEEEIMDAVGFYRYINQIASGFYYKWRRPAPQGWLDARKEWASFVRKVIGNNRSGIDTEWQVAQAISRGKYSDREYGAWKAVKDTFKPEVETIWLDDTIANYCASWAAKNKGLIWVDYLGFGKELSKRTGLPFFAEGGLDPNGTYIEDHEGPAIVSIASNYQGKNLQKNWNSNLIVNCPSSGAIMEQLIGRTHRSGQESESVNVEILVSCYEQFKAFQQCKKDAEYIKDTQDQVQKVLYADIEEIDELQLGLLLESDSWAWRK